MKKTGVAAITAIATDSILDALEAFAKAIDMRSRIKLAESHAEQEMRAGAIRRDLRRRIELGSLDELRVVDRVLGRLELGRDRYGELDLTRPREWRRELREELLDALVYDVAEELAAEDVERAALREDARREMVEVS